MQHLRYTVGKRGRKEGREGKREAWEWPDATKKVRECMDIEVHKYTCLPKSTISLAHAHP